MRSISFLAILLTLAFSATASPTINQDKREPAGGGASVVSPPSFLSLLALLTQVPMPIGNDCHRCQWLQKFMESEREIDVGGVGLYQFVGRGNGTYPSRKKPA
ncbi:hypothetical protein EDB92DRAFT_1855894 [Lactarius akahatsu]|uniref:Uncharacterized protein n=1 Tax=Lactarius akahatsu TaxID=416441 RepID=A0AAD4LMU4_9AGAM|nr:hypothetical protein EDB92DRAFT_1855894 [Lactarius akahatsu]